MSADFAAVLAALPAEAVEIRQRLDWTNEKTYRTLVRLYDRGMVRIMPGTHSRADSTPRRIWELAEDDAV